MADTSQVREITAKLEQGVKDLYTSDRYADYLRTMSRFHQYSTRNTLLIHMQKPDATLVAGFRSWQTKFGRSVKKGEKSIKILAPVPFTIRDEKEKLDPDTMHPIIGDDGMPVIEYTERQLARFKVTSVFDVSQTAGKPIPSLVQNLTGDVAQYNAFMDALRYMSPLPIVFEAMPEDMDGACRFGKEIAIRAGMSEIQTVCAAIHEIAHAKLHDRSLLVDDDGNKIPIDRRSEEVVAESVSYAVCQYFGIETGDNSFGYLAEWSRGRDLKELNASLDTIRKTATEMIMGIEGKFKEIVKEREITLAVGEAQGELSEPLASDGIPASVPEIDRDAITRGIMPDPFIGCPAMSEYGYAWDGMLPLTQTRATELFDSDQTIFLLYPDNTEAMIFDRSEIANHDGIFGIERADLEASLEYAEMKAETKNKEGSREYVDSAGFVEIDGFLGEERAQLPEKTFATIGKAEFKPQPQVGDSRKDERATAPKGRPTLAERLAENKHKAAQHEKPRKRQNIESRGERE